MCSVSLEIYLHRKNLNNEVMNVLINQMRAIQPQHMHLFNRYDINFKYIIILLVNYVNKAGIKIIYAEQK